MHPTVAAYCSHGMGTVQHYEDPPPPIPERNDTQDIKNMTFIGGFIAMLTHGCLPILVCSEDVAENYCNHLRTEISSNLCQNHAAL